MKVITLASGSKGNCTLIQSKNTSILVDAGIVLAEIEDKLSFLGVEPSSIDAIIITHEHGDHIRSVANFSKKYDTNIYASQEEWNVLISKLGRIDNTNRMEFFGSEFSIKDIAIVPFKIPHDSFTCFGYSFLCEGKKISIATDLGECSIDTLNQLIGSDIVILEANHDINTLVKNPKYPAILKQRILSKFGHLSNKASAEIIEKLVGNGTKQIILAHLSEENNSPMLAYSFIKSYLATKGIIEGSHIFIDVATQHKIGNMFEI